MGDRPFDARYGTSIRVKTNVVEVLRRELARKSWKREQVVVGTATDPYQPAEGRWRADASAPPGGGCFPPDARLDPGHRRRRDAPRAHHPWPDDRSRHRR